MAATTTAATTTGTATTAGSTVATTTGVTAGTGGTNGAGGATGGAGDSTNHRTVEEEPGACSCRTMATRGPGPWRALVPALVGLALLRRRRRAG
jgi:MYXO-CTERM domain-containing protein